MIKKAKVFNRNFSTNIFFSTGRSRKTKKQKQKQLKQKQQKQKSRCFEQEFLNKYFFSQQEGEKLKKVLKNRCFEQEGAGKKTTKKQIF